jgi:hypothetical protein
MALLRFPISTIASSVSGAVVVEARFSFRIEGNEGFANLEF